MVIDLSNPTHLLVTLIAVLTLQVLSFWIGHTVGKDKWNPDRLFPGLFIMIFSVSVAMETITFLISLGSFIILTW